MISVLLLHAETEAKLTHQDVYDEVERISEALGYDFSVFLKERDGKLYFEAPEGALKEENWIYIPPKGTNAGKIDSPAALALFFLTVTGLPFSAHNITWAEDTWKAWEDGLTIIIEAFRGSGKSIFMRICMAFMIGVFPTKSSIIVRATAPAAKETSEAIANIIANNAAWKLWFPDVKPKSSPGQPGGRWSGNAGYDVIDISIPDEEWKTIEASRTSPTLTKYGLGSKGSLGSRASLVMLADDLVDDESGVSVTEIAKIESRFQEVLEPARTPESRLAIIGTPWGTDDLLQRLPRLSDQYRKIKTPITKNGKYPGVPTWPQFFGEEAIRKIYEADISPGKRGFKRNRLLDLEAEIDRHFTYRQFDAHKIEEQWPVRMGVDFAALEAGDSKEGRSYFAVTVTTQEPISGSWIIFDGFVGQIPQSRAERVVIDFYNKYGRKPRVECITVELAGSGKIFERYLARLPIGLPLFGADTGGVPKEVRWESDLEPSLANDRILISDAKDIPFLVALRIACNVYPNIGKRGDPAADILDSVLWAHYWALMEYGDPVRRHRQQQEEVDQVNPWAALIGM